MKAFDGEGAVGRSAELFALSPAATRWRSCPTESRGLHVQTVPQSTASPSLGGAARLARMDLLRAPGAAACGGPAAPR